MVEVAFLCHSKSPQPKMLPPDSRKGISRDYLESHGLLSIPPEIILMIAEELPAVARISLSLTCKEFLALCPQDKFRQIDEEERLALLLLLERDVPARFLCFGCKWLALLEKPQGKRRFNSNGRLNDPVSITVRNSYHGWPSIGYECVEVDFYKVEILATNPIQTDPLLWDPGICWGHYYSPTITFSEVQLIMNRHFYGAAHGISAKTLESSIDISKHLEADEVYEPIDHYVRQSHTTPNLQKRASRSLTKHISASWRFTHRTYAKVIGNNLFICRVHNVVGPPCLASAFTSVMDSVNLPVCKHIHASSGINTWWVFGRSNICIPALHSIGMASYDQRFTTRHDDQIASCPKCFTDYEVHIKRGNANKEWEVNLRTYHNLGSCRSPDDAAWSGLVSSPYSMHTPDYCREGKPGDFRQSWLQHYECGNREFSGLKAEWALSFHLMTKSWFSTSTDWDYKAHYEVYSKSHGPGGPAQLSERQVQLEKEASATIGSHCESQV